MSSEVILGTDLMLFKDSAAFAVATNCKFTINANVLETSSKDSGIWAEKKASKLSWTASTDNLYVKESYTELVTAMIARTPVNLQFSTAGGSPGAYTANQDGYKGTAIITSIDANAPDNENATYSVTFEGTGALSAVGG